MVTTCKPGDPGLRKLLSHLRPLQVVRCWSRDAMQKFSEVI